jgi:hypothetical protein
LNPQDILRNGGEGWGDVDLEQLESDPDLETALNAFASASRNQVLNVRLQQEKAHAVIALLDPGFATAGDKQP